MKDFTLFIDETGDHDLVKISKEYPIFGLASVAFANDGLRKVQKNLDDFKGNVCLNTDVILHTADIVRSKGVFSFCEDPDKRKEFYRKIDDFLNSLDFTIIFSLINKEEYIKTYKELRLYDVYALSLRFIEERFYYFLTDKQNAEGKIIVESRGGDLDKLIYSAHDEILSDERGYIKPADLRKVIKAFEIRDKKKNLPGLQVADLVASQLGRHYLWLRKYWGWNLEDKMRKRSNKVIGCGVKIFP